MISFAALPESLIASGRMKRYDRELEAVIGPRWKLIRGSDGSEELYDAANDPDSRRDLSRDPKHATTRRALRKRIDALPPLTPAPAE